MLLDSFTVQGKYGSDVVMQRIVIVGATPCKIGIGFFPISWVVLGLIGDLQGRLGAMANALLVIC